MILEFPVLQLFCAAFLIILKEKNKENDYFIYEMFYTNLMVTTKHKSRTEA